MRILAAVLVILIAPVGLTACGGKSKSDKAKSTVCDARSDIAKQVSTLQGLTASTVTVDAVSTSLKAIGDDLGKIKNAQGDLSDSRKQQVQSATDTFTTSVKNALGALGKSVSASAGKADLTASLQQLAASYKQAFAPVDCS